MGKRLFWIVIAFLFLIFAAEDWAFYRPWSRKLDRLDQAIAEFQDQILGSQIPADRLQKIKDLIEENSIDNSAGSAAENWASQFLGELMALSNEMGIELLSIEPGSGWGEDLCVVYPFKMELRCEYHQLRLLLEAIERSRDLIHIKKFQIFTVQEETLATLAVDIYFIKKDPDIWE